MKRHKWLQPNSVTSQVLREIGELADDYLMCFTNPGMTMHYGSASYVRKAIDESKRKRALFLLKEQERITTKKIKGKLEIGLTKKGVLDLFRLETLETNLLPPNKRCAVLFDIPETRRRLRSDLRKFLIAADFEMCQRSVWISRHDVGARVSKLFHLRNASRWIHVWNITKFD